jgi:hypothetical protein
MCCFNCLLVSLALFAALGCDVVLVEEPMGATPVSIESGQ